MYCKNQCVQIPVESSYYGNQKNKQKCLINYLAASMYPGGYPGFQVTGVIEWGQKSKPKKIPGPKFNPPKAPCGIDEP